MIQQLLIGFTFSIIISLFSYSFKFLTRSGSVAQCILGTILLGIGGWQWTMPVLSFFLLSSLISRIGRKRKQTLETIFEKTSQRDAGQVLANGGVAGIVTLLWFLSGNDSLYIAYLGSVAAATADTWGTELGSLSRWQPILLTNFRRVEHGRSGAVSFLGVLSGLTGALMIFLSGAYWVNESVMRSALFSALLGGSVGSLADSMLGATLQVQFRCRKCGRNTERKSHCGIEAEKISGYGLIGNDAVNLACTIVGAIISLFCYALLV